MVKKMLIVEEALRDLKAHWFGYIKTIADAAEDMGWEVAVACHKDAVTEIQSAFSSYPIFQYARYLDNKNKKLPGERHYSFILHSRRVVNDLWNLLKEQPKYNMIFVPTVLVHHLLAWYTIMKWHPNRPQKATLFFVTNPGIWDRNKKESSFPKSAVVLKFLLQLFRPLVTSGIVSLAVETEGAKAEFEKLSGLPFILLPHPVPVKDTIPASPVKQDNHKPLLFGCYGFARYEKGSDILKQAIEKILTEQPDFNGSFQVQWTDAFTMPDGTVCEPGTFLLTHPKIKIIDHTVNGEEYKQLLRQTDCMMLPYRNDSYYARLSRIAIESATSGIPVIYTKWGWLEKMISQYGAGIGTEDESVDQVANAIFDMVSQYSIYKAAAVKQTEKAKDYYSPQNFCKLLLL